MKKGKAVPAVSLIIDGVSGKVVKKQYNEDGLFWNNYPILVMQAEDKVLSTSSIITYDQNLVERPLNKILKGRSAIIFKFSLNSYKEEVDSTLKYIHRLKNENVIILMDAENIRYYRLESSREKMFDKRIYYVEKSSFDLILSDRKFPFFFLLSTDNKMSHFYVPRKEIPIVTSKYLDYMINYLRSSNTKNP